MRRDLVAFDHQVLVILLLDAVDDGDQLVDVGAPVTRHYVVVVDQSVGRQVIDRGTEGRLVPVLEPAELVVWHDLAGVERDRIVRHIVADAVVQTTAGD